MRLRSTLEVIQDCLVRAGKLLHNPGPRLFRQIMQFNIRDSKEESRLEKDLGLSNLEQRSENRVFQAQGNNRRSDNNNTQQLGYNNRPAICFPPHKSS
ncbi:MAG: hypothetical protein EZS28_013938 [Streblomastix strix]|uniref:Uncharacterized protein n=1 Tax=Streblomastix strix TaxID=222440 RepID=A0A5J4W7J2_9EUKA|nr:MAG: hypothetical protein EZS28_013938 [Streblomastix strix]